METLLDKQEAADLLNVTPRHLDYLIYERRIPFVKVGGRTIRFKRTELLEWIEAKTVEAAD